MKEFIEKLKNSLKKQKRSTIFWCSLYIISYVTIAFISMELFGTIQLIHFLFILVAGMDNEEVHPILSLTNIPMLIFGILVMSIVFFGMMFMAGLQHFNNWLNRETDDNEKTN